MHSRGLFIVLEGSDGSGKTTQFNLLKERLKAVGYDVAVFDFPRYDKDSSYFVRNYLNGHYGPAAKISPYTASLFYALDRFEAAGDIKKALDQGKIVLSNRYTGANMAHQGSKFSDPVEQRGFFVWADNLEFQLLQIPRPDINIFLRVPAEISEKLVKARADKTGKKLDEHEKDLKHLKKSVATYDLLCELFPKDFRAVECTKDGKIKTVADINNLIWKQLKPLLPDDKPHSSHSVVVTLGLNDEPPAPDDSLPAGELQLDFKDASLILWLHLQRSSINAQPDFKRWADSGWRFFEPAGLPKEISAQYKSNMRRLAEAHAELRSRLIKHLEATALDNSVKNSKNPVDQLLLPLTPLAALSDVQLNLKKSEVAPLAASLLAADAAELQSAAKQLYLAARQKWPKDFDSPLESKDDPVPLNDIIAKLAQDRLPQSFSSSETVKLLEARPRLEFNLLAESIYPHSSLSLDEIAEEVSAWPYTQKYASLKEAASRPETLTMVRYKLDVISDQIVLSEMLKTAGLNELQVQALTPRYGYEVPQIIEGAGLEELYDGCYDDSLKLYSLMQGAGQEDSAAYATLLGHKVRWQLNADADQLRRIFEDDRLSPNPAVNAIGEKVAEVHPLLWEIISHSKISAPALAPNGKSRVKPYHRPAAKKKSDKKRP